MLSIPAFEIQTFQVSIPAAYPSCDSLAVSCLIFLMSTTICQLSPVCRVPRAIIQMTSWSAASDDGGIFDNGSKRHIYYLPPGALYAVVVLEISISSDISHKKKREATYLLHGFIFPNPASLGVARGITGGRGSTAWSRVQRLQGN